MHRGASSWQGFGWVAGQTSKLGNIGGLLQRTQIQTYRWAGSSPPQAREAAIARIHSTACASVAKTRSGGQSGQIPCSCVELRYGILGAVMFRSLLAAPTLSAFGATQAAVDTRLSTRQNRSRCAGFQERKESQIRGRYNWYPQLVI